MSSRPDSKHTTMPYDILQDQPDVGKNSYRTKVPMDDNTKRGVTPHRASSRCRWRVCVCITVCLVVIAVAVVVYMFFMTVGALQSKECVADLRLPDSPGCNRDSALCMRKYSDVSYATMHNAYATTQDGIVFAQHRACMRSGLVAGIRGFMLDVHLTTDGDLKLCHARCSIGSVSLAGTLLMFVEFLQQNPREVVTILWEVGYDGRQDVQQTHRLELKELFNKAIQDAGLVQYLHVQPFLEEWPTLQAMIDANRRLVILTDSFTTIDADWDMYTWSHAFDTPFSNRNKAALERNCKMNRGRLTNRLFIMNHITVQGTLSIDNTVLGIIHDIAPIDDIEGINMEPFMWDRVLACTQCLGRFPNFVAVDFWDSSDVISVTRRLNSMPVGSVAQNALQCI